MTSVTPEYENYGTPAQLASHNDLSDARKIELLEKWYADEQALTRAAAEGLNGGEENNLAAVLKALKTLKPEDEINNQI